MRKILFIYFVMLGLTTTTLYAIDLTIIKSSGAFNIEAEFYTGRDKDVAIGVLRDYENLPNISSSIISSRIIEKTKDGVVLDQIIKGRMFFFFSKKVHLVLDVVERGDGITLIDTLKKDFRIYKGTWFAEKVEGKTRVVHRLTAKAAFFVPSIIEKRALKKRGLTTCEEILAAIESAP